MKTYLVGLSLSQCVSDIVRGVVNYDDVLHIITGTCSYSSERWEQMLEDYCRPGMAWSNYAEAATEIANRLFVEGKITEPRADNYPAPNIADGHWVEIEIPGIDEPVRVKIA